MQSREFYQVLPKEPILSKSVIHFLSHCQRHIFIKYVLRIRSSEMLLFQDEESGSSVNELGLTNVGGIFLVLLVGVVCSVAMAVAEKAFGDRYVIPNYVGDGLVQKSYAVCMQQDEGR